jgi:hypothetical protein
MLCPNPDCRHRLETGEPAEYVDGITVCADCAAPLVEELAPALEPERFAEPTDEGDDEPVEVERLAELTDPVKAGMLRSFLEQAGIASAVRTERRREGAGATFGFGGRAAWLWVESARVEEAREILAAVESGAEPIDEELAGDEGEES